MTTTSLKAGTKPFWYLQGRSNLVVDPYALKEFLELYGFGQFQLSKGRLNAKSLFRKDDENILTIHNSLTIKNWIRKFLEERSDSDFYEDGMLGESDLEISKREILRLWMNFAEGSLQSKVLDHLTIFSEQGFDETHRLHLFNDKADEANIRFLNGIVRITKDEITLIPYTAIKNKGAVWSTDIIERKIKLDKKDNGLFYTFAKLAMYRHNPAIAKSKDWRSQYELGERAEEQYQSMRRAYGFLIHTHNNPDVTKCVYFIDADSELGKPQGGNGKSLVLTSLKYYKKLSIQDGKRFRSGMDSGRFQFADVDVDTRIVLIDDIRPEFSFDMLFSMITGDMEVERKGKDKFTIPAEKKPKFGITTNYVIPGSGTSYTRRQHIVEFGNYWSRCNQEREKPSDKKHLGSSLFDSWTDDEWSNFYNFGFRCVQQYFKEGLVAASHQDYAEKVLKLDVEGADGDGLVYDWIDNFVNVTRVENGFDKGDGISVGALYKLFSQECSEKSDTWDQSRLSKAVFTFAMNRNGIEYNQHLASKGSSFSSRRWLRGPKGKQTPHIKITGSLLDSETKESSYAALPLKKKMTAIPKE